MSGAAATQLRMSEPEVRKVVTVLFSDVTDSTRLGQELDPEAVRQLVSRYFGEMKVVVERHGGVVEKFIGDAVMAVFGVPQAHEDDALRAVRAAQEMRDELRRLNEEFHTSWGVTLVARTGLYTGEVIAGDPARGESFVVGDSVNTASRLENAAQSVVLVYGRDAEDRHHRVADELLNRTAVALDHILRDLEVPRHHSPETLGVELLAQLRRAGDVAEEDGDDLSRLARRPGGQQRPAGVAEPGLLPVLHAAAWASRHGYECRPEREVSLSRRTRERAHLLEHTGHVGDRPVLGDLPVPDPVDGKALGLDLVSRSRDAEQLAGVCALAEDVADDEVALGDLHPDLVPAWRRLAEHLGSLLDPVTVGRAARKRRIVDDDVLGDVLVDHAPVARVVVVDRLDVAADKLLVRIGRHFAPFLGSERR